MFLICHLLKYYFIRALVLSFSFLGPGCTILIWLRLPVCCRVEPWVSLNDTKVREKRECRNNMKIAFENKWFPGLSYPPIVSRTCVCRDWHLTSHLKPVNIWQLIIIRNARKLNYRLNNSTTNSTCSTSFKQEFTTDCQYF